MSLNQNLSLKGYPPNQPPYGGVSFILFLNQTKIDLFLIFIGIIKYFP